ncbi:hypothetical protein [Clostridium botulinum]|nr:hypothetical protein [Clostridium botulinum]
MLSMYERLCKEEWSDPLQMHSLFLRVLGNKIGKKPEIMRDEGR